MNEAALRLPPRGQPGAPLLTLGEVLIAVTPATPAAIAADEPLVAGLGGAELNFAVALARLGLAAGWIGALGDDALGRLAAAELRREGVDLSWARVLAGERTALYLREWLPDGRRRASYYREGTVGRRLEEAVETESWPAGARWLHLTGITASRGGGARRALDVALAWATARGVPVSFDPNYRPAQWPGGDARAVLLGYCRAADLALVSEEDAELLVGETAPRAVIEGLAELGVDAVIYKRGERGACALDHGEMIEARASAPGPAIDPVGAGDGFDAGFVAGWLGSGRLSTALELGCLVGGHAVAELGDQAYPLREQLPLPLREALAAA